VQDPRDHPYVLGATKDVPSFNQALEKGQKEGKDYLAVKAEWKAAAGLSTFDDAAKSVATEDQYKSYMAELGDRIVALQERRAIAMRITNQDVLFDWELPRLPTGQYMWQWSVKQVVDRAILAAPLGDVTWSRQGKSTASTHPQVSALRTWR
jgi:isocitrate lyase